MASALEQHDLLVRTALEDEHGSVFKHTGDGAIAEFDRADEAVRGALRVLNDMRTADWTPLEPLEVRISVHAGTAQQRAGDWFGPCVNHLARINSLCQPSQVVASDVVRSQMGMAAGIDLGLHALRGVPEPLRLWQLDAGEHPTLKTSVTSRSSVPVPTTELIGRSSELGRLTEIAPEQRLTSIVGPGGSGKTRLAIAVAHGCSDGFPGGSWLVDLSSQVPPAVDVGGAVLGAIGLSAGGLDADGIASLIEESTGGRSLLILDNCEHIVDDVADFVEAILNSSPSTHVLATSREPLEVAGERVWRIPALGDEAETLFLERARAAGATDIAADLATITRICDRLDRLPLAIELAAAQAGLLPVDEIERRLDERLMQLGETGSRRRRKGRTLESVTDWSYRLLTEDEQQLLDELTVFAAPFSIDAVEAIATPTPTSALDRLLSLAHQSLIEVDRDTGRYRLLETVRQFGSARLDERGNGTEVRRRLLDWVRDFAGFESLMASTAATYRDRYDMVDAELPTINGAMEWAWTHDLQDEVMDLFLGIHEVWGSGSTPGLAGLRWVDRLSPPTDPERLLLWLSNTCLIELNVGLVERLRVTATEGVGQLLAATADPTIRTWPALMPAIVAGVDSDDEATHQMLLDYLATVDTDQANPGIGTMLGSYLSSHIATLHRDPAALQQTEAFLADAEPLSRFWAGGARDMRALELFCAGRFDEAEVNAFSAHMDTTITQLFRASQIPIVAASRAAQGDLAGALDASESDVGPMLPEQQEIVVFLRLEALVLTAAVLDQGIEITHAAALTLGDGMPRAREYRRIAAYESVGIDVEALPSLAAAPDALAQAIVELRAQLDQRLG